jgi:hypothetical protein
LPLTRTRRGPSLPIKTVDDGGRELFDESICNRRRNCSTSPRQCRDRRVLLGDPCGLFHDQHG